MTPTPDEPEREALARQGAVYSTSSRDSELAGYDEDAVKELYRGAI